jgi:hypothetical protein
MSKPACTTVLTIADVCDKGMERQIRKITIHEPCDKVLLLIEALINVHDWKLPRRRRQEPPE